MKALISLYGYIRFLVIVVHNIYHVLSYLYLNWIVLLPLRLFASNLYNRIEVFLYNWCLYTVSSWSWLAGIYVYNCGAELPDARKNVDKNKPVKICIVGNHQCTGDVPLLMYKLSQNPDYIMMWIMSAEFKYSNFGPVSLTHEDYFLNQKSFVKGDLVKHCTGLSDQKKNCFILFPEGGFRYKRLLKNAEFATKNNLPQLNRTVWPRYGAFDELLDERIGITHIVDLTILYCDQENPITIFDIAKGIKPEPVYFLFRVYEITHDILDDESLNSDENESSKNDLSNGSASLPFVNISTGTATSLSQVYKIKRSKLNIEWLRNLWKEKEQIMNEFYTDKESFFKTYGPGRRVDLAISKIIAVHLFYISTFIIFVYCCIFLYNLIISQTR
ncbi:acyl-CoA:lysophosphatidylglycerol acyltransferase 1 [Tetranychus urticae]|uniref:Phospholipid/glycerol acyltransferase domain-containing protein n=1 Tax=Tetranychus urticae TaxID=32264 RepID=T1KGZ0_TETUR|nr:acyl-CoA:lysophosphatidylglycerol acyltransferase 1 [Tetranychus urticae]